MLSTQRQFIAALLAATGGIGMAQAAPVQQVEISAATTSTAAAQAVMTQRGFEARYALSNGRQLAVSAFADGLLVSYPRHSPTLLRPDGQGNFLSRDGQLVLRFEGDGSGEPDRMRLVAPANWL